MLQSSLLAPRYANIEELLHLGQFPFTWRGKLPVTKGLFRVLAGIRSAIALEYLGRVVRGIKADAEQMCVLVELRIRRELLVDLREVAAHTRAVVCQRAARVDQGHQKHFATILLEVDLAVRLIEQCEVR